VIRWLLALLLLIGAPAAADEFKPAYLQLTERGAGSYDVLWKVPALDEATTLRIKPVFPSGTRDTTTRRSSFANGAAVVRWRIAVPGGLNGQTIAFPDQAITRIDILVRVARADGTEQLGRVLPGGGGFAVTASPGKFEVIRTYTLLGIEHILTGFDHLLFVLALVILVKGTRRLLWTVTAFTIAHSITLALATLGIIHVPGPPVEATIALSIVFVASEIIQAQRGHAGLAAEKPWLVAFSFGLLHGLGFAGALAEVGLPANSIPLALLFFNVGVEIGQLLFIVSVLALARLAQRVAAGRINTAPARIFAAYAIGGIASYWVIERVVAFWV
jgi:hydrogenase/urease accessory protein HupE